MLLQSSQSCDGVGFTFRLTVKVTTASVPKGTNCVNFAAGVEPGMTGVNEIAWDVSA